MKYCTLDHIVRVPCGTELYTMCYRAVETFYWAVDHELTCPGLYFTGPTTLWYGVVYHELLSRGHVLWAVDNELP